MRKTLRLVLLIFSVFLVTPFNLFTLSVATEMPQVEFLQRFEKALQARILPAVEFYVKELEKHPLSEIEYLHLISIASAPSAPPCFINQIVAKMGKAFPKYRLSDYFFPNGALKEKALTLVLHSYLPKLDRRSKIYVVNSYGDLTLRVKNALETDKSYGIFFHEGENAHWTLVYLNKHLKKENCTLQILDTVGHIQVSRIIFAVQDVLPQGCKIAHEPVRRQYDTTTCSVFAITDFLELSERDEYPLEFHEEGNGAKKGNVIKMKLAPSLMALAQSSIHEPLQDLTLHEIANQTTVVLPKQAPLESLFEKDVFNGDFCRDDIPTYFNFEKDVKLNAGSKMLHDQYVKQIIETLIHSSVNSSH